MKLWQALILGIVQGITEFLPISSSGHLVLVQNWLQINPVPFFFDIFVHLASLAAIIYYFRKKIWSIFKNKNWKLAAQIAAGTLPIAFAGLLFKNHVEDLFSSGLIVSMGLLLTSVFNFTTASQYLKQKTTNALDFPKSFLIGLTQVLAIVPGISRSGSTLFGSSLTNVSKKKAFEFSFLLSIPAISTANLLYIVTDSKKMLAELNSTHMLVYAAGGLTCFIISIASLKLLKKTLNNSRYHLFGWYCLILGIGSLAFFALR